MVGRDVPREHGDADDPDAEDAERDEEPTPLDDAPEQVRTSDSDSDVDRVQSSPGYQAASDDEFCLAKASISV
jgi:hypothetical protein